MFVDVCITISVKESCHLNTAIRTVLLCRGYKKLYDGHPECLNVLKHKLIPAQMSIIMHGLHNHGVWSPPGVKILLIIVYSLIMQSSLIT